MSIKEKLFYKNDKKAGEKRISKFKIIAIGLILFLILLWILSTLNPLTSLMLDDSSTTLDENQTEYTIKGSTEAKTVQISSSDINLSDTVINVTNGKFEYNITIPKSIKNADIRVVAKVENKSENYFTVILTRD